MTATIRIKQNKGPWHYNSYVLENVFNVQTIENSVMVSYLSDDKNANRVQNAVYALNDDIDITVNV